MKSIMKVRFRLNDFLFIRKNGVTYSDPDGEYDVYELFKCVFPFVYVWTGTWTYLTRGNPANLSKLRRIIDRYKEKSHV